MAWTANHLGPDGLPPVGYWGPITSSLLWCEDKYRWSKYIAEPMNTFTNVAFIALALFGVHACRREALPSRFAITHAGIALVGMGSFAFHATLLYQCQLLDELPMIYTSLFLSYCILETNKRGQAPLGGIWLPLGLVAVAVLITVGYLALPNPVLHQVAYGAIQIASTIRVLYHLYSPSSPLAASPRALQTRATIRNSYKLGCAVFLTGFLIWNLDNIFCDSLRLVRARVGYPLAALVEGHAWWHILTGYGAYHLVVSVELMSLSIKEAPENFAFKDAGTLRGFCFPQVVRIREWDPKRDSGVSSTAVKAKGGKAL